MEMLLAQNNPQYIRLAVSSVSLGSYG